MPRTRCRFAEPHLPHFLTDSVVEWLPIFTRPEAAQILFDAWTHQQQHAGLHIYGFVVLENHLHAVAKPRGCRIPGGNSSPSRPVASSTCSKSTAPSRCWSACTWR
jgi:hypothetical protein